MLSSRDTMEKLCDFGQLSHVHSGCGGWHRSPRCPTAAAQDAGQSEVSDAEQLKSNCRHKFQGGQDADLQPGTV